jgi:transcriptional regulator with XRE-family HTH domain
MNEENKQFLKVLGSLVLKHRIKISKSEEYLANYLNIDIEELSLIEDGEQEMSLQTLSKLNKLFTIDLMIDTDKKLEEIKNKNQKTRISFSAVLGSLINSKRTNKGLTQDELAKKIRITRVTLSKIENGDTNMSVPKLALLDIIFNSNLMQETRNEIELLEKNKVKINYSDIKNKNNTGKYIAGAAAIAALLALLR